MQHMTPEAPAAPRRARASKYDEAIEITRLTVYRRGQLYRALVVVVSLATATTIGIAVVSMTWQVLSGLLFIPMFCSGFLLLDNTLVVRWRRRLLTLWSDGTLEFGAFGGVIAAMRTLPTQTVGTMLASLPASMVVEAARPHVVRLAVVRTLVAIDSIEIVRNVAVAACLTVATGAGALSIITGSLAPMLACVVVPFVLTASRGLTSRRLRTALPDEILRRSSRCEQAAFASVVAHLNWRTVPARQRDRFVRDHSTHIDDTTLSGNRASTRSG
jgi:hypothetical protein